jgi:hypothetical protein
MEEKRGNQNLNENGNWIIFVLIVFPILVFFGPSFILVSERAFSIISFPYVFEYYLSTGIWNIGTPRYSSPLVILLNSS